MTLWEYHIIVFKATSEVTPTFNRLGNDGWELVSMVAASDHYVKAVFKRPKGYDN